LRLSRSCRDAVTFILYLCVLGPAAAARGQLAELEDGLVREVLAALEDEDAAVDGLDELLRESAAFREHRVDVNSAGPATLLRVPLLRPAAALCIVATRDSLGPVSSLDELVTRGCLSSEDLAAVRPYLEVLSPTVGIRANATGESATALHDAPAASLSWELRLRSTAGEEWESSWGGRGLLSGAGTFARVRLSHAERLDLSLTCAKDAGERTLTDHVLTSLVWRSGSGVPGAAARDAPGVSLGVGDFIGSWGQGLLFRGGGFPSEGAFPRRRDRLACYDGASEGTARRGVFATVARGGGRVSVVLARTRLDAVIGENGLVTSIRTSGYHRTEGEREGARSLTESLGGVRIGLASPRAVEVSASVMRFSFSPALGPNDDVRQHFAFGGNALTLGGCDARLVLGDLDAGCELAWSTAGGAAAVASVRLRRGNATIRGGAARLSRDYWSPLGGGVPGCTAGSNCVAGWAGVEYRSAAGWRSWISARVTSRPWRSYHSELPDRSSTVRAGGEIRWKGGSRLSLEGRSTYRRESCGEPVETGDEESRRLKVALRTGGPAPVVASVTRAASYDGGREDGSLLAFALRVEAAAGPSTTCDAGLTSAARSGRAPTSVHYEPALPGEFALASLNTPGTRWYIRIRTGLSSSCGLSVRLSGGPGRGRTHFGVGLDARG
jgi:hypothetical protein